MSSEYSVYQFNGETQQEVIREATVEEIFEIEQAQLVLQTELNLQQSKASARNSALAKLAELGLTQEEIEAL